MANVKDSDLTAVTSVAITDIVAVTVDPATTPATRKITVANFSTSLRFPGTLSIASGKTFTVSNTLTFTGTDSSNVAFGAGGTVAYTGGTLAQFAATTSAQLLGVISDETGSGALVFGTSPTFTTGIGIGVAPAANVLVNALVSDNSGQSINMKNGSSGTGASASFKAFNDANSVMQAGIFSTGNSGYGAIAATDAFFYSTKNVVVMSDVGTGVIKFATGGNSERLRIGASGWLIAKELAANPTTAELADGDQYATYRKTDKLVLAAVNIGGTINYLTIDLDGSDTTLSWSTTGP